MADKIKAPGLSYRKRRGRDDVPYWVADKRAVKAGYPVKLVNLSSVERDEKLLIERCTCLTAEMHMWLGKRSSTKKYFDGTFKSLIDHYLMHPESPYKTLTGGSVHPYTVYAGRLKKHIGNVRVDLSDGLDAMRWFKVWAGGVTDLRDPAAKLPAAKMAFNILKTAASFGAVCRLEGCKEFMETIRDLKFPKKKRRSVVATAANAEAARAAAHAAGDPGRALGYALQYETTLRQWDVFGMWVDLSDPRPSLVLGYGKKWLGPMWSRIDANLIFKVMHGKTDETTGLSSTYDLSVCPMVMEELAHWPAEARKGPLIIDPRYGRPWRYSQFKDAWKRDFTRAGLPHELWNRDFRAGGTTEGGMAGATQDDRSKMLGHTGTKLVGEVYDRDTLEAHRRTAKARNEYRKNGNRT